MDYPYNIVAVLVVWLIGLAISNHLARQHLLNKVTPEGGLCFGDTLRAYGLFGTLGSILTVGAWLICSTMLEVELQGDEMTSHQLETITSNWSWWMLWVVAGFCGGFCFGLPGSKARQPQAK